MSIPVIATENLTRIISGEISTTLVEGATLAINPGEFVAITGPSGGGKSSLLYLLGLLDQPTAGRVLVNGEDVAPLGSDALADIRLNSIGFIFQFHFLLEEFTALENVMIPMRRLGRLSEAEMMARASALLKEFDLVGQEHKHPSQLSGGQRQRVAIARALANQPRLLLAVEPTGNLDTKNADAVFAAFRRIVAETGAAVVVVTHDMTLAARTDRRIHIVDGHIV